MFKITINDYTTLDKIVYEFYKNESYIIYVLEANKGLEELIILEPGLELNMPLVKRKNIKKAKRLWD